jgi:hypothetical protein
MSQYKIPLVNGTEIYFRGLTASETDRFIPLLKDQDNPLFEEFLFNLITDNKYQAEINSLEAGAIITTLYSCLSISGYVEDRNSFAEAIDASREKAKNDGFGFFYAQIIKHMPAYKISELKLMSLNELLEAFALCEMINKTPIIDTDKIRTVVADPKKEKVINILTSDMMTGLASALKGNGTNFEGMPMDLERDFFV